MSPQGRRGSSRRDRRKPRSGQRPQDEGFFKKINLFIFIYVIFGCVGSSLLRGLFSSCSKRGLLFIAVPGLLIMVASLVEERGLLAHVLSICDLWALECRLSSCGTWA